MAVEKVFWEDPYLTELSATVTGVRGDDVTLDRTIFYAFSGGQESDAGSIGGCQVKEARKEGKEIVYTLETPHSLKTGDVVTVKIDWERRYSLMRLHFSAEIVLELMYQKYSPVEKIGAHISSRKARVDFGWVGSISRTFPVIAENLRSIVLADLSIRSAFDDMEKEQRYWEIPGFARVSCGGTHLKRTGEVGIVNLRRNNIGKGKERIEITLADPSVGL